MRSKRRSFTWKINDVRFLNQACEFFFASAGFEDGVSRQRRLMLEKSTARYLNRDR
jgi:hypothetical protein